MEHKLSETCEMNEAYNDHGLELSAGDFQKIMEFLDTDDVEISICEISGIKFKSRNTKKNEIVKMGIVNFATFCDATSIPAKKTWILDYDSLKSIAKLIPDDVSYWENLANSMMYDIDQYERRHLPTNPNWESDEKLFDEDPVYRKMKLEYQKAICHVPSLGCFLFPNSVEFYLTYDTNRQDFADIEITSKNTNC